MTHHLGHASPEWLKRYATSSHQWKEAQAQGGTVFYRPLGLVEGLFDSDGIYYEGRADINMSVTFEIKTTMSREALRRHILLAWANLRLRHTLLMASATSAQGYMDGTGATARESDRFFVVQRPKTAEEVLRSAQEPLVFLEDHYATVDADELYHHAQNTARTLDAEKTLARLLVLPLERASAETHHLRFLFLMGHEITDGLTGAAWTADFLRLLNQTPRALRDALGPLAATLHERLPVPQEDLYPPVRGSRARQRWYWAISLVLRHVQRPYPAAFPNPLLRCRTTTTSPQQQPAHPAVLPRERTFARVLDYSRPPALNTGSIRARLGPAATRRLHRVCRQAGCSIGAGAFVLVAVVMMELHEQRRRRRVPDDADDDDADADALLLAPRDHRDAPRRPFVGSFPVNPRPLFDHHAAPDGVMLAFSDGVVLPFLPSSLPLDGRIKLLVRSAQRQLSRYQKRAPRRGGERGETGGGGEKAITGRDERERLEYMGPRGAGRVVATTYLDTMERARDRLPPRLRREGLSAYRDFLPKRANPTLGTCGVSSVGRVSPDLRRGRYDVTRPLLGRRTVGEEGEEGEEGVLVADLREHRMNVRARDGEFLVGVGGDDEHIAANVSYDACAIDPALAEVWRRRMETILEPEGVQSRL